MLNSLVRKPTRARHEVKNKAVKKVKNLAKELESYVSQQSSLITLSDASDVTTQTNKIKSSSLKAAKTEHPDFDRRKNKAIKRIKKLLALLP